MRAAGLIAGAFLALRGQHRTLGIATAGDRRRDSPAGCIADRARVMARGQPDDARQSSASSSSSSRRRGARWAATIAPPTRKAAAIAVIENPFAGRFVDDLEPLMAIGEELGGLLGERAVAALGVPPSAIESYGKAAIVGEARRTGARRRHPASAPGRAAAPGGREGCGAGAVGEEDGRHRHRHRRAARPQGRGVRAQPLRRDGGPRRRRAARRRDRRGGGA